MTTSPGDPLPLVVMILLLCIVASHCRSVDLNGNLDLKNSYSAANPRDSAVLGQDPSFPPFNTVTLQPRFKRGYRARDTSVPCTERDWCSNGGKCSYRAGLSTRSCTCTLGHGGERCELTMSRMESHRNG
ncbi:hypothetical protein RvY_06560 [Ramazzottius varieornatus]|uniref:EGF-like domain-containing protein n=1 Tax=Ramazzottius varieornatus TaxID=947166 RepID=A0A1D1V4G6_RAMVA|nr:hypothetical protein RvY_06560 [Ramazzottius varieornatus]